MTTTPFASAELEQDAVNALRVLSLDQVQAAGIGHIGLPLGAAPIIHTVFAKHLVADPVRPDWVNRDRFVLSAGHGSALLYSALHLAGYAIGTDDLRAFRKWGSITPGHPESHITPGVDATTGPLGQGFANAVGMAIAETMARARLVASTGPLIDHRTFALVSDGDLMEGVALEAAALAGRLELGRLVVYYDDNDVVIDGRAATVHSADAVSASFAAYGWHVSEPIDGNDLAALDAATEAALADTVRPSLIRVRTVIGYGSTFADTPKIHSGSVSDDEVDAIRANLGWDEREPFVVPERVRDAWRCFAERGARASAAWDAQVEAADGAGEPAAAALAAWLTPIGGVDVREVLASLPVQEQPEAARVSGGRVLAALGERFGNIVGGSADLVAATMAEIPGGGTYGPERRDGRNIAFGIREHAMSAITNGIALHGLFRPFASTFMVFASYQANSLRMAALQELPVVHVLTHDSIGVGEDGPTHQPIEMLATLRATPNTTVLRPADAFETAIAWKLALAERHGPSILSLSRSPLPPLDRSELIGDPELGASVVRRGGAEPDVILVASGTEVALALDAADTLEARGVRARVVSLLSHEVFHRQSDEYRRAVLRPQIPRLVIEASHPQSLWPVAGPLGGVYGVSRFGASAAPDILLERYGFTATAVADAAQDLIVERVEVLS